MKYSFDTSSLSNPWRKTYPPDVFPKVWEFLSDTIENGIVVAHATVLKEVENHDNAEFLNWVKQRKGLKYPFDVSVDTLAKRIQNRYPKLVRPTAKVGADPFVIALAKQHGFTVVSEETLSGKRSQIEGKIPFVCQKYNVTHIDFLQFMREREWKFN